MKRVLIIEDDSDARGCLAVAIDLAGYAVSEAQNGREGLREARQYPPDVILLDLMMPVMDGLQFRAEQKKDPALAEVPVIVVSAVAAETWPGLDGVMARFQKPFKMESLLEAVEQVCRPIEAGAAHRASSVQFGRSPGLRAFAAGREAGAGMLGRQHRVGVEHHREAAEILPSSGQDACDPTRPDHPAGPRIMSSITAAPAARRHDLASR